MRRAVACAAWMCIALLAAANQRRGIELRNNEIWLTREGSPDLQLTADGCEKGAPVYSPDGGKIAYYTNTTVDKPRCASEVIVLSPGGGRLKTIRALARGNAVMRIDWLGNHRIGIDTHITPSSGEYRILDATSGKQLASYFGYGFSASPDSRHIAHAGGAPHFGPAFAHNDYLLIDDKIVYPRDAGAVPYARSPDPADSLQFRDIHEFQSRFAWAPDGTRIAFIERLFDWRADAFGSYSGKEENERWFLVAVPVAGGAQTQTHLPKLDSGFTTIQWIDSRRVKVGGSPNGVYMVVR